MCSQWYSWRLTGNVRKISERNNNNSHHSPFIFNTRFLVWFVMLYFVSGWSVFSYLSGYGLSQWGKTLQCNVDSQWRSIYPEWYTLVWYTFVSIYLYDWYRYYVTWGAPLSFRDKRHLIGLNVDYRKSNMSSDLTKTYAFRYMVFDTGVVQA